jgi:hypothetical protein
MTRRRLAACLLLGALALAAAARQTPNPPSPQGERIYREGILVDGAPLRGQRKDAPDVAGKDAACINCHGRSGMGVVEGRIVIPPITGTALFRPGEHGEPGPHDEHRLSTPPARHAYDDATLARAIRDGLGADGRRLDVLMPRFSLDEDSMRELIAHLHRLSVARTPGIVNGELNFATIVTPDADPVARDAMLAVLREYFAMKNDFAHDLKPSPSQDPGAQRYREEHPWRLHVWQLAGAPDTWGRQLDEKLRAEPVFAVISGIGGRDWAPVHAFCERQTLPCLFPNVDLPVVAERDFYPVYFSRGVLLEADLMANRLARRDAAPARVLQVFRSDDVGVAAAAALRHGLAAAGYEVLDRALAPTEDGAALARALAQARPGDALVLWLRGQDLARLPQRRPAASTVLVSGLMGGLEAAPLPPAWREAVHMTYPYALPEERRVLLNYPMGWFRMHHIALADLPLQVDTYIACSILSENLISTHGNFLRDFLVERVEAMIGSDLFNGNFKRMGLAPGQRFAAKGGYLVHFTGASGSAIAADGDWIVP